MRTSKTSSLFIDFSLVYRKEQNIRYWELRIFYLVSASIAKFTADDRLRPNLQEKGRRTRESLYFFWFPFREASFMFFAETPFFIRLEDWS